MGRNIILTGKALAKNIDGRVVFRIPNCQLDPFAEEVRKYNAQITSWDGSDDSTWYCKNVTPMCVRNSTLLDLFDYDDDYYNVTIEIPKNNPGYIGHAQINMHTVYSLGLLIAGKLMPDHRIITYVKRSWVSEYIIRPRSLTPDWSESC
jgi:hypothetical protein